VLEVLQAVAGPEPVLVTPMASVRRRCGLQRALYCRGVRGDDLEVSARRLIRLRPALLPIAQGADRDLKPRREFFLRQARARRMIFGRGVCLTPFSRSAVRG